MSRMLDVLEEFLTLHGHTYVRLDGSTGVEKRQRLMDRSARIEHICVIKILWLGASLELSFRCCFLSVAACVAPAAACLKRRVNYHGSRRNTGC